MPSVLTFPPPDILTASLETLQDYEILNLLQETQNLLEAKILGQELYLRLLLRQGEH